MPNSIGALVVNNPVATVVTKVPVATTPLAILASISLFCHSQIASQPAIAEVKKPAERLARPITLTLPSSLTVLLLEDTQLTRELGTLKALAFDTIARREAFCV